MGYILSKTLGMIRDTKEGRAIVANETKKKDADTPKKQTKKVNTKPVRVVKPDNGTELADSFQTGTGEE